MTNLERLGLINDAEFAKMFTRSRMITRPEGSFLLRRELQQKGISERDIESALEIAFVEKSEIDLAFELAVKQKRKLSYLEQAKIKNRVTGFLQRRGFGWETIQQILDQWTEMGDETEKR